MTVRLLKNGLKVGIFGAFSVLTQLSFPTPAAASDNYIVFADSVAKAEKKLLQNDLENLKKLSFVDSDQSATKLFNTTLNPDNLRAWLYQRSRYVVPDNFPLDQTTIKIVRAQSYTNPEMPEIERGTKTPDGTGTVKTIMSNIGAALYLGQKMQSVYFSVGIPGAGDVKINSPRVGIFKIGEGMFLPLLRKSGGTDYQSFANSIWRLSVFFHEARHSDGNGKSLGFIHAVCPEGHAYAGYNACDKNLNGPYTVGAQFIRTTTDTCTDCSEAEKEALRNTYTDSFARIMNQFPAPSGSSTNASANDPMAELRKTCEELKRLGMDVSKYDFCKDPVNTASQTQNDGMKSAEVLDDTPEKIED